jgi:hypothetical protein
MHKHTPGPWTRYGNLIESADEKTIAYLPAYQFMTGSQKSDSCLIAAAPELLEALEQVIAIAEEAREHLDHDRDMKALKILTAISGSRGYDKRIDAIHNVIAKAKGEQL